GLLENLLPQQVAKLAQMEGNELVLSRNGTADVNTAVAALWADLSPKGSMGLSADRLSEDLALAKRTERSADDALSHVQAAQAYMAQADGLPFQFHAPTFIGPDRAAAQHLEKALTTSLKLSHPDTAGSPGGPNAGRRPRPDGRQLRGRPEGGRRVARKDGPADSGYRCAGNDRRRLKCTRRTSAARVAPAGRGLALRGDEPRSS